MIHTDAQTYSLAQKSPNMMNRELAAPPQLVTQRRQLCNQGHVILSG